ncbi:MAG: diguanylate cyclase [Candidatus Omnitrophica bacterium]|nr:diguanylate cyclase [Candidatus Omnitrophota bacterium]
MTIIRPKILIADDEPSIRDAIKAILLSEHYEVVIARNGKEAVDVFKKESPDLVILDVCMPYLDGFKVLKAIKKFFAERYIPVIFLTASVAIDHKLEALSGGAVDYLTKPVSPQEILARIRNFLEIKARHDTLKEAAVYDWMTGAMNKGHFIEKAKDELELAVRNKTPLSFIFMDIDGFKKINDEVGHLGGDAIIGEFGRRLKKTIRKIDLLGRFGGDEFMIMLPHKGKKECLVVAGRIARIISSRPMVFEKAKVRVSTSQGLVALETDKMMSMDQLIQTADEALYEAKTKGGNCYVLKTIL